MKSERAGDCAAVNREFEHEKSTAAYQCRLLPLAGGFGNLPHYDTTGKVNLPRPKRSSGSDGCTLASVRVLLLVM
jgi:hypothetical protein